MTKAVKPRRAYDSPRRDKQARATRRAILDAARDLFTERGYVATTMQAIGARAGTSPATVYAVFTNKRSILSTLVDVAIGGDDAPVPILDRPWVQAMREEPDLRRRLATLATNGRLILERRAPIDEVVRAAAASNPEISALYQQGKEQRLAGQRQLLRIVAGSHPRRAGVDEAAGVDILYALGSPETYRLLTDDRGWSSVRFERWYADTLARLLFDA
ncbi:MAG: helix-turn-helix domain-containing protein [Candidatus Limnocylindria bacterium]